MSETYYTELPPDGEHLRFRAGPATTGPWDERMQHGGPPNALAVAVAERAVAAAGRTDLVALRCGGDFVGPVPVGELRVRPRIVRAARSAVLVEVVTSAEGRECLHDRVWFVRDADTSAVAAPLTVPAPPGGAEPGLDVDFPYGRSIEWRMVRGAMRTPGPAVAWARPRTGLAAGLAWSGLSRAVLVCDSANGLSAELDWARWAFLNVDLDVHLARPAHGDWVLMEADTQLGGHGSALARSTISDERGALGAGLQTLLLAPR